MKKLKYMFLLIISVVCFIHIHSASSEGIYKIVSIDNPKYHGNELFHAFETYYNPRIQQLRKRYNLDQVVENESNEWKRILLLRHWIKSHIEIDNQNPTQTREDTFSILDAALQGGKFHCTHFSIVQHAVLNSFGYVTRRLGCGPGTLENGGHHGVNEVWVNSLCKWVIVDAKYDLHFEKDGTPLSALEIRDEIWKNNGESINLCFGPDGKTEAPTDETAWEISAETYRWCSWETDTNRFTSFPAAPSSTLVIYDDEIFRNNTWYRNGKPHWAYNTPYFLPIMRRDWIEWTPNVIRSTVKLQTNDVNIFLESFTPNFETFQMKDAQGNWQDCEENLILHLRKETNEFRFRIKNRFGVTGPEHAVKIQYQFP